MPVQREDPYAGYNFLVEIEGVTGEGPAAGFSEVSGLGVEIEVIGYRAGNDRAGSLRKLPGVVRYPNIVLKRGVIGDTSLWEWMKQSVDGAAQKRSGSIVLLSEAREQVVRWSFFDGWPCRWDGPSLDASGSRVALETLEICHAGLEIV